MGVQLKSYRKCNECDDTDVEFDNWWHLTVLILPRLEDCLKNLKKVKSLNDKFSKRNTADNSKNSVKNERASVKKYGDYGGLLLAFREMDDKLSRQKIKKILLLTDPMR